MQRILERKVKSEKNPQRISKESPLPLDKTALILYASLGVKGNYSTDAEGDGVQRETQTEQRLAQSVEMGTLIATYGYLLTEKQRAALHLYYDEDQSLAEIAGQFGVSRQNIHDLITRARQKLYRYEDALHSTERTRHADEGLYRALHALEAARADPAGAGAQIDEAIAQITRIINEDEEGEDDGI